MFQLKTTSILFLFRIFKIFFSVFFYIYFCISVKCILLPCSIHLLMYAYHLMVIILRFSSHKIYIQVHSQVCFLFFLWFKKFIFLDLNIVYLAHYCSFSFTLINIKNRNTIECNHITVNINSVLQVWRSSSCIPKSFLIATSYL